MDDVAAMARSSHYKDVDMRILPQSKTLTSIT